MTADDAVQAALERVSRHRKSLKKHWALSVASGEDVWEERCSHDGQTWPCDAATLAAHIAELERELEQCRGVVEKIKNYCVQMEGYRDPDHDDGFVLDGVLLNIWSMAADDDELHPNDTPAAGSEE